MSNYQVGDRVVVDIANPHRWAWWARVNMQFRTGTIREVKATRYNGKQDVAVEFPYLVEFDTPVPGNPIRAATLFFHFAAQDLKAETTSCPSSP